MQLGPASRTSTVLMQRIIPRICVLPFYVLIKSNVTLKRILLENRKIQYPLARETVLNLHICTVWNVSSR